MSAHVSVGATSTSGALPDARAMIASYARPPGGCVLAAEMDVAAGDDRELVADRLDAIHESVLHDEGARFAVRRRCTRSPSPTSRKLIGTATRPARARRDVHLHPLDAVVAEQRHAVALAQAEAEERVGEPVGTLAPLREGDGAARVARADLVGRKARLGGDDLCDVEQHGLQSPRRARSASSQAVSAWYSGTQPKALARVGRQCVLCHDDVEQRGRIGEGFRKRAVEPRRIGHALGVQSERARHRRVVRPGERRSDHAPAVVHLLIEPLDVPCGVVRDDEHDLGAVALGRVDLHRVDAERAVAGDDDHLPIGMEQATLRCRTARRRRGSRRFPSRDRCAMAGPCAQSSGCRRRRRS